MTVRERMEQEEYDVLAPHAQKAAESQGRLYPEEDNDVRTCYQRDADRILHSKSFRRLMHKTQVFLSPEGDHYRTRMTHTLEVARIARTICRGLRLNQDLAEAAAYGHDLGHTPFGHAGEAALTDMMGRPFHHNEQSLRVVDQLERDGRGLNLTYEVRMGILGHTGTFIPETWEGQIVRVSDRIAYINHDIDDAVRGGIIRESDIPAHLRTRLGASHGTRIDTLVTAMIDYGLRYCEIGMDRAVHDDMMELRQFMFEHVYRSPEVRREETRTRTMLQSLYRYFAEHPDEMPDDYFVLMTKGEPLERVVCDYVASMTDRYSIAVFRRLFIPNSWSKTD